MAAKPNDEGGFSVEGVAEGPCKGLQRGVVCDLDEAARSVDDVVRKLRGIVGEVGSSFVVNVNGSHLEGQNAQGFVPIYPRTRQITREDVLHVINHSRQLMPSPEREQVLAIPREFRVDGQKGVSKPIGMSGGRLEVVTHIVTAQTTHLQNIEKVLQMTGNKVEQIVAQPIASGLGVATQQEMDLGCAVVDIGGGTTSVAVFANGAIAYSSVIPVGSQAVTSDLSKLLKTAPEEAERLKVEHGSAMSARVADDETVEVVQLGQTGPRHLQRRVLCEIIESRVKEIALLVKQQIEKSGLNGVLPGGVILTGGGCQLPDTVALFEQVLKHMAGRIGVPQVGGALAKQVARPTMAAVAGLAAYVLASEDEEIAPASGIESWKVKIRTLKALFSNRI